MNNNRLFSVGEILLGLVAIAVVIGCIVGGAYLLDDASKAHTSFCLDSDGQSTAVRMLADGDDEDGITLVAIVKGPASLEGQGVRFTGLNDGSEQILAIDKDHPGEAVATIEISALGPGEYHLQINGRDTGAKLVVVAGDSVGSGYHDAGECSVG